MSLHSSQIERVRLKGETMMDTGNQLLLFIVAFQSSFLRAQCVNPTGAASSEQPPSQSRPATSDRKR